MTDDHGPMSADPFARTNAALAADRPRGPLALLAAALLVLALGAAWGVHTHFALPGAPQRPGGSHPAARVTKAAALAPGAPPVRP